jgi:tRNA-dihydrouridine synthase
MNFWKELPKPFSCLAPMEDVTDTTFRQLIAELGRPDVFFTEFTSTDGLMSEGRKGVIRRLEYTENERPLVAQIWGNNPDNYYESAKLIVELGFDGIDINMGCPVRKVVSRGQCSGLIQDPPLAAELIKATIAGANGKIPVSVKTRLGFAKVQTEEWAGFLLEQDIDVLTVHGRVAKHLSKFPADWSEIGKVVKLRDQMKKDTLIIGNGDLMSLEDIESKHKEFGVDGGMVGRGIFKNPYLFNKGNKHINQLSTNEKLNLLMHHTELFVNKWGTDRNFNVLKRFFKIYISEFEGAAEIRGELMNTTNIEEVKAIVEKYTISS